MKYKIEIEETITRVNTYTVEAESEEELQSLIYDLENDLNVTSHHKDVSQMITDWGCEVVGISKGEEKAEYELM